ncbi:hypothetical protein NPIL_142091 [Nephila pilipes]|uniref:Uncharacterized protein n=1 Tax=Nephila pilipes TaxID=299642 RepID=A0A8X6UD62_NEPPI|nr:hypothetical protein NPIL_142091 [Nephila pilipes]
MNVPAEIPRDILQPVTREPEEDKKKYTYIVRFLKITNTTLLIEVTQLNDAVANFPHRIMRLEQKVEKKSSTV